MSGAIRADARAASDRPYSQAGLVLDRYQPQPIGDDPTGFGAFLQRVVEAPAPAIYSIAYAERRRTFDAAPHTTSAEFRVAGSGLIVGLGGASVRDTSIALLRNYGVPYIPGSALKGLARAWVRRALEEPSVDPSAAQQWSEAVTVLFGDQASAAYVVWHDAWYVPGSAPNDRPLRRDVITVHHPTYYSTRGKERAPWDLDDPNPVSYLTATGRYLVAIDGPNAEWAALALDLLTRALADFGAGAKTSSGYGRLLPVEIAPAATPVAPQPAELELVRRIREIDPRRIKSEIGNYVERWRQLTDHEERYAVARAILERVNSPNIERKWRDGRSWYQEVVDFVEHGS